LLIYSFKMPYWSDYFRPQKYKMPVNVIAPYVGAMGMSGTGQVETMAHANVTITAIEYIYKASLGAIATSINVENRDISGQAIVVVSWSDVSGDAFEAALRTQMAAALGGAITSGSFATTGLPADSTDSNGMEYTLLEETRVAINNALANNALSQFLESDVVGNLTLVADWSGAAANMRAGLTADLRELMFLQIPDRVDASGGATDGGAESIRTLDYFLRASDKLAFVFNVSRTVVIAENVEAAPVSAPGAPASATQTAADPAALYYTLPSRRVGFVFTK
jgi:hypothetical protein